MYHPLQLVNGNRRGSTTIGNERRKPLNAAPIFMIRKIDVRGCNTIP
jgi:hypothetical protein